MAPLFSTTYGDHKGRRFRFSLKISLKHFPKLKLSPNNGGNSITRSDRIRVWVIRPVGEDFLATGFRESVGLEFQILVERGDARVADFHNLQMFKFQTSLKIIFSINLISILILKLCLKS